MKRFILLAVALLAAALVLAGCNSHKTEKASSGGSQEAPWQDSGGSSDTASSSGSDSAWDGGDHSASGEETAYRGRSRYIVVYFSQAGDQYKVGNISKGNTEIVAHMIADEADADIFRVKPVNDNYNTGYKKLLEIAKKEKADRARPKYRGKVDFSGYDIVFFGAPVWLDDWPMIMYSFFEDHARDLKGKTLIPFSTHEGSGLAGFDQKLRNAVPGCRILDGFSITGSDAQKRREYTEDRVENRIDRLHIDDHDYDDDYDHHDDYYDD